MTFDTDRWLMPLAAAGICAAGMAVLVTGIALALGTTGHDWYAAWKFTLVEAMLAFGFSDYGLVQYRTAAGETVTVERYHLAYRMHEAWSARRMIFSLAADRALLGACTGLALFAMWLAVLAAARLRQLVSGRGAYVEPAPRVRRGHAGRMRRPDDWSDEELIAALSRRSRRMGVLLVPADEVERLSGDGHDATGPSATPRDSLSSAQTRSLAPSESVQPAGEATAVPAKPAPHDPGSRPDKTKPDDSTEGEAFAPGREPGEQFF
ncbi:MAG: hypothetical protein F4114_13330 [Rhodospirillaceae bacterium]|nr:hypothetical protein [Rhodospirillaceae bacterium]MYI50051.1 hypothetical protein [Rhodospirillaceae bacterium]